MIILKLYCDTNIYNRCFDEQNQLRIRLECTAIEGIYAWAEAGLLELTWSFVLAYENSLNFPIQIAKNGSSCYPVCVRIQLHHRHKF
jgi:hypothetical protein